MSKKKFDKFEQKFIPVNSSRVKVFGEIGRRIDITIQNNLLKLDIDKDFLSSFKSKKDKNAVYIGVGKLIDSLVKFSVYSGSKKVLSLKKYVINEIVNAQEPDGYIGNMIPGSRMCKLWDVHEMGYIIFGLLQDYLVYSNTKSLLAAEKAADYIIKNWSMLPPDWDEQTNVKKYVAVTGLPYTLLILFKVTGKKHYYDFCLKQLNLLNWNPGIIIGRRKFIEGHVYAYLSMCLAQLELYKQQKNEKLLKPLNEAINFILRSGMTITGGVGQAEVWTDDQDGRGFLGETCATAYQLRIYDELLRYTGKSMYGDIMERTIYNALFAAQSPDGRKIRYFTPFEGNRAYHDDDTYCCPNNYRRIISELPGMIYYRTTNGVMINLYSASSVELDIKSVNVQITQETDYPNSGKVNITLNMTVKKSFPVYLRIPSWCESPEICINGNRLRVKYRAGKFAVIDRVWKNNDKITLDMPMEFRLIKGRARQSGRVAVMRGPLLFCLNPEKNKTLSGKDGADLGMIVIDHYSVEKKPVKDKTVRPKGIGCKIKACDNHFGIGNEKNIKIMLTEFPDPNGKSVYFRTPDMTNNVISDPITCGDKND